MEAIDFLRGVRFGLMLAQWLGRDEELIGEREAISVLGYKTKTMFLNELVMCKNAKLRPVILGKTSRRKYKKSDVYALINKFQMYYDVETAEKRKHSMY